YIAETPNAIGLVGFSHIGNPEDTAQINKLKKVKMAYVQCTICPDSPFVKPMQQSISSKHYPLVRGIYYIINETHLGLGTDFTGFLKFERGQLIFRRAYLVPVMQFDVRAVKVNEKIPEN
ncbi:MAG: phosphate ABC transporter substrate-binding protein, PhoT family, partial [Ferruginibacter sp.]